MSIIKNLKIAGISTVFLALVSCGNKDSNSSDDRQEQRDRITSIDWKIYLQGRSFPTKARVEINDTLLLDECMTKNQFDIDRSTDPQSISMEAYSVPTEGALKIAITDLGSHCGDGDDSVFFAQDNVPFDIVKTGRKSEVIVNL